MGDFYRDFTEAGPDDGHSGKQMIGVLHLNRTRNRFEALPRPAVIGHRIRIAIVVLLLVVVAWLALPAIARADDCSNGTWDEVRSCPGYGWDKNAAFLGAALAAIGGALSWSGRQRSRFYSTNNPVFGPPDYSKKWPATPKSDPSEFKNLPKPPRNRR
jgi:hypothetical protein